MKVTVILTAYKEPNTIAKAIGSIIDIEYSGCKDEIELIQLSPDKETLDKGKETVTRYSKNKRIKFKQIQDPGEGKPAALNLGIKNATGSIVIFTDGDIYLERNAIVNLVEKFEDKDVGAVSGRPVSSDSKTSMMGYYGHLFADANHYRRMIDISNANQEKSKLFVKKHPFFPMSGYIMAVRKNMLNFELPKDVLVDDAYISYMVFNQGVKIAYEPEAVAFIKYPKTLSDYFKQKVRSTGGYIQLWKYGVVKEETKARGIWRELEMFWFPFKYAKNLREFMWSACLLPIRAWLWFRILVDQKILKKDFDKVWVRVESTK